MKKYISYILILGVGILLGSLVFSKTETQSDASHIHSEAPTGSTMYTCSMHPQIMQPEPGDCPICGMGLIPAESSTDGLALNEIKMTANAMALANIQTTIVGTAARSMKDGMLTVSGKIAVNEENNAVQASYFDGRLERFNVNVEGQEVRRGQLLATIYAPELVAAQQELITAASLKESQPALYSAVRNKLRNFKISERQISKIESSGNVIENFPIYATVSGTVTQVIANEGDYVKQGQPILKVSNLNNVWATFDVYENQIAQFKIGQAITVVTNTYPTKEFDTKISFIDPILNTKTRTVNVRATLSNKEELFKPGMFVTAKVKQATTIQGTEVLSVPATAVLWTGERSLVYIKTSPSEPVFEMREVIISNRSGDRCQIISGLQNGDEIVTNGTFTVDAAAQLQGKKSMMNQGKSTSAMADMTSINEMEMDLPMLFQKDFSATLPTYFKLKDAFVASDGGAVHAFAKALLKKNKAIQTTNLGEMERTHFNEILKMTQAIAETDRIDNQRKHFVILNENMVALANNMNNLKDTLYVQNCAMTNDGKGGIWLSLQKEIRNPYYGDAMLSCGSLIAIIK